MIVRKLRLEMGLSQEQLARMSGISTRTLQRIERGGRASPETLKGVAAVLDVDFNDLRRDQMDQTAHPPEAPRISEAEKEAMEYVRDIKAFYGHLFAYAAVVIGLTVLNLIVSPHVLWVIWVAFGWGIGVAAHALSVFEVVRLFSDDWEKRQIEKRLRRR